MNSETIGKFQVLGPLGNGAHSAILHIRREEDGKQYALKVVPIDGSDDHKFLEQAEHELEIGQMLNHPNLIKIFALETQRDWLFRTRKVHLLIEYVDGKTLDTLPRLPMPKLVQVFARVAAGLTHMHKRYVCHADLKPNNILLSKRGEVKVIDYGLSWIKGENKGRVQGTLEYMAPEQAKRKLVNERTDIFNLGATMYRLTTGKLLPAIVGDMALEGKAWEELVRPVQEQAEDAPPLLCELIHRCLAYQPLNRPERMNDVQEALNVHVRNLVKSPRDRLDGGE